LASWDIKGNDTATGIVRVLKALGLVTQTGEPTEAYTTFMQLGSGPAILAGKVRDVYAPLFGASLEPYKEAQESLRNLFNIHSGGAAPTIDLQIQTFKALSDYSDFSSSGASSIGNKTVARQPSDALPQPVAGGPLGAPIHIDLHIHLPENKSSRDYQYIIQDIARFIYQNQGAAPDERE